MPVIRTFFLKTVDFILPTLKDVLIHIISSIYVLIAIETYRNISITSIQEHVAVTRSFSYTIRHAGYKNIRLDSQLCSYERATLARATRVANTSCPHSGLRPSSVMVIAN